ncbi:Hypothetical protein D9617_77g092370 [Elsinoe fawcettii]|nr:Hypothetical protein D9617_77g092370 [Elsinoe fawcettii]
MPMSLTTKEIQQIFGNSKTMPLESALVLIYQARGHDRLAEGATSFGDLLSSLDMYDPDHDNGFAVSSEWFGSFLSWQDEALNRPPDMVNGFLRNTVHGSTTRKPSASVPMTHMAYTR